MLDDIDIQSAAVTFTEDDYVHRRADIHRQLRAARSIHDGVALLVEKGQRSIEDLRAARERVADLEGRLTGVEGAWKAAQEQAAIENEGDRLRRRAEDAAIAGEELRARADLARKLEGLFKQAGAVWREMKANDAATFARIAKWGGGDTAMFGVADQLTSGQGEQIHIGGLLFAEGFDRLDNTASSARHAISRSLADVVEDQNRVVVPRFRRSIPELKG